MATRRWSRNCNRPATSRTAGHRNWGRRHEEMKALSAERYAGNEKTPPGMPTLPPLGHKLEATQDYLAQTAERLSAAPRAESTNRPTSSTRSGHFTTMPSFAASSRQIELVARGSEVEKLSGDLTRGAQTAARRPSEKCAETIAENRQTRAEADAMRKKVTELERKMSRMLTNLTDAEERLERREKGNWRGCVAKGGLAGAGKVPSLLEEGSENGPELEPIETRFETLERENRELQRLLDESRESGDEEALREQMHELAAEVVAMTARLEKPGSEIGRLIDAAPAQDETDGRPISLADRIRALRAAPKQAEGA